MWLRIGLVELMSGHMQPVDHPPTGVFAGFAWCLAEWILGLCSQKRDQHSVFDNRETKCAKCPKSSHVSGTCQIISHSDSLINIKGQGRHTSQGGGTTQLIEQTSHVSTRVSHGMPCVCNICFCLIIRKSSLCVNMVCYRFQFKATP